MLKNIKYILIDENNKPIKNENDSFDIKTTEIILENSKEINEFNTSNLESSNQQINELQTKNTELISQLEQQTMQLKQIEINNFNNSLTDNEELKNVLLKSYDINDDIEVIKTHLQSVYDELIKVQTVNTGSVPKTKNKLIFDFTKQVNNETLIYTIGKLARNDFYKGFKVSKINTINNLLKIEKNFKK